VFLLDFSLYRTNQDLAACPTMNTDALGFVVGSVTHIAKYQRVDLHLARGRRNFHAVD